MSPDVYATALSNRSHLTTSNFHSGGTSAIVPIRKILQTTDAIWRRSARRNMTCLSVSWIQIWRTRRSSCVRLSASWIAKTGSLVDVNKNEKAAIRRSVPEFSSVLMPAELGIDHRDHFASNRVGVASCVRWFLRACSDRCVVVASCESCEIYKVTKNRCVCGLLRNGLQSDSLRIFK